MLNNKSKRLSKIHRPNINIKQFADDEEFQKNPLYQYNICEIKERRHYTFLKRKAIEAKIKLNQHKIVTPNLDDDAIPISEKIYRRKLYQYVKRAPIPKMLHTTERKLLEYIPKRHKNKYPRIVEQYMNDVHNEFDEILQKFSIQKILKTLDDSSVTDNDDDATTDNGECGKHSDERQQPPEPFKFKRLGRTRQYHQFLYNRKKLQADLLLPYPFIRCILHYAKLDFQQYLNDYGRYHVNEKGEKQSISLCDFENLCEKDLQDNCIFIKRDWYPKIVRIMIKYYRKHVLPKTMWPKIMACASGLINRQINELKILTFQHIFNILLDRDKIPYFKFQTICENRTVDLCPNFNDIKRAFYKIFNDILDIGKKLPILESQIDRETFFVITCKDYLKIEISDGYMNEIYNKLNDTLCIAYSSILAHVQSFQIEYYDLYGMERLNAIEQFLAQPKQFEEYLNMIDQFNEYVTKLRRRIQNVYFDVATINQEKSIIGLRNIAEDYIKLITANIVIAHKNDCIAICNIFEGIRERALEIPKSTEMLLANGEYMLQVKTKQMFVIQDRIRESLRIGGLLVELTELSKDHLNLQIATINWFKNINEIFEQNASLFENYKFQFEEHLQYVTKKLNEDIAELIPNLSIIDDMSETEKFRDYNRILSDYIDQLKCFDDYVKWINKEEKLFKFPITHYEILEVTKSFVIPFAQLMKLCIRWLRHYYVWMDGPFEYLNPKFVETTVDEYYKEFLKTQKYYRNRIKQDMLGNTVCKFRGQTEDPDPEKHPVPLKLCGKMIDWIKEFRLGVYIVNIMCNSALRFRHWEEMSEVSHFDITPDAGTTLRKIINYKLETKLDSFEIISIGANKELQLQTNLKSMIKEWDNIVFPTGPYKDTNIYILSNLDDVQALLDDHILKTLTMRGSAFVKPCETEVRTWYDKLLRVNNTFEEWGKVQANWLYLLPIFSSKDIVAQMPEEGRLFAQVDQTYRRYITMVLREPNVMQTAPAPGLLEAMQMANEMLENIINGVNEYLEKKRLYFPRFFFLSNDEMLEILSETKDPLRVQPHLNKCFEGIYRLKFNQKLDILAMQSNDMEEINLVNTISTVEARGSVEIWLLSVEREMLLTVQNELSLSYFNYLNEKRIDWILKWSQMIILCISQIFWAQEVHSCLQHKNSIHTFYKQLENNMSDIVNVVRSTNISNLNRITIKSLIVIDVHAKDVINELIENKIQSEDDFQWLAQLRYYWINGSVQVKIINATVNYANEYLGNSDRLVITPLTDRCYRTLIGAYQLHLNGAPEGPAGTGKTETTKDLAKALAVQCKVFNCSDGLDFKAMGKFFKGLASSGAWACFDEFNRIELEVLSVVAQQILCIIVAVRSGVEKFTFEGTELILNPACYVCITMNPGYAGRSELPDNLKVLFRTVAMMVPDYAMIGEISLYSYGFLNARTLAVKIVTTYRLCSEQLSSQNHYDYGMRAVKTVLSACGNIKLTYPNENEDLLLLRALLDVNLPKFLSFDIPLFEGIISDLFPGIKLQDADYSMMYKVFLEICNEQNLQPVKSFFTKIVQTYEMIIVRHGFMMVGEPYAGKSTTLKTLASMLCKLNSLTAVDGTGNSTNPYYQNCQIGIVNPKSITMGQLYGAFDPISYEWTDGIASTLFRNFAIDTSSDRKWLIFDGPVDAVWIENMNTVLDDNKKLCLTSGEVITMNNQMSVIFEVMDLLQASPATVSRCGMIYMEPKTLGYETFIKSWINKCNPNWINEWKNLIFDLFMWILPQTINFVKRNCHQLLNSGEFNLLMTTLNLFEIIMNDAVDENPEDYQRYLFAWIQANIIYSVAWGIGGLLDSESREKFDGFYREIWQCTENNPPPESMLNKVEVSIPLEGQIIDYVYIFKQKGAWKYWPDLVRRLEPEIGPLGIQVPTVDTGRYMHLLDLHIKHKKKILFVGPTGTGKSFYTQNTLMNKLNQNEYMAAFMTFTVMITANQTQELLLSKLLKHKRGRYGPPRGKTCVIFVDDMNMPAKEIYGAQPPIELLRQYFDYKYVYDLKDTSKIYLNDVLIFCACGVPGGSRQTVYPRFLCHFNCFSINTFSDDTMIRIFSNVLLNGFKRGGHTSDVIMNVNQIVNATLNIYGIVSRELRPTPAKSHYIFNVRDIAKVCLGCSLLRKESVDNKKIFAKIWFHETMRVFYDRLVDDADRSWFFVRISNSIRDFFHDKIDVLFENQQQQQQQQQEKDNEGTGTRSESVTLDSVNKLIFGTYLDLDTEPGDRRYEEIPSFKQFNDIAITNLDEYNSTHKKKMNIVLFSYALEHLNKICRIISMPAGNGLLVGMSGSGRQSLTRLAATICQQTLFQPEITKNYSISDWREDLKQVLKESGGLGKDTIFLVAENQIKHESFLTDIDCLLNLGEVPNIWPIDEKQEILEMVRLAAQGGNRNIDVNPLQVFSFFINRCKNKLHIILCFSPIGTAFRTRIRLYPSLVNCCTIDWYDAWPQQALEMVANRYIATINVPDDIKIGIVIACKHFHVTARGTSDQFQQDMGRITYITSASFLELIRSFTNLITSKQNEIMDNKMRYIGGLETLVQAAETVAIMQKELNELQPKLIVMAENSKQMTAEIETKTVEASIATEQVKRDEVVANAQAAAAEAMEDECSKDLAQAVPVLEEALQALNTLKPTDITLVKSMKNPPNVVKLVMAAVCVMKSVPPDRINDPTTGKKILDYWIPSKRILGDMAFLQTLKDYEKDNINPDIMKKIRKDFIPNKDFQPHIVAKASSAAEGLCKWIIAIDRYDAVAKVVAPKQARLYAAKEVLKETRKFLAEKRALAEELDAKVARLNEELVNANAEKERTEIEVEMCKNKLKRAEALISGLGGEKSRWTKSAENLQYSYDRLAGDILISCGIIAYLSTLTMPYRTQCVIDWHSCCQQLMIPCSDKYNLIDILGSEIKIQNWNLAGLPRDAFSTENAIIMDSSSRYSLFIDPQGQANKWIKVFERHNRLQILKFSQTDYMKTLEVCMEFGNPALIENIGEDIEAPLDPILQRTTFIQGGVEYISVGDNVIPLSPKFRLYLTTNLRNPHYLPETFNKVTLINFALTQSGLEDQLLGIVVAKERPDLQELREKLIIESAANKAMLKNVEVHILKTLSQSKGDILEDESAIQILDNSKILSLEIIEKERASRETSIKIESFRENYKLIASHAAILYYCITDLPNIDPMYQFSLNWYINLYVYSIEYANKSKELLRRLKFLIDAVTQNLYNQVCRSIFEKDKLLFSFILTIKIMLPTKRVEHSELMFLLTGAGGDGGKEKGTSSTSESIDNLKNPDTNWITIKMWDDIKNLNKLSILNNFANDFINNLQNWRNYYDANDPHLNKMPEPWETNLTKFQKLIILRAIHPDKLFVAITEFVRFEMSSIFVTPPHFDIAKSFEESNCLTPLIFILSPGADPMSSLTVFAEKMGFDKGFQSISLGQGQGPIATKIIEEAQEQGAWICLQNCHLSVSWMPSLEQIWEHMDIYNTNPSFRMWLTSYPTEQFPSMLLQNGIKITNEPPTGLQQNLLRSYLSEPMNIEQFYNGCPGKHKAFTRLLYGICFFHAVVQERLKFGAMGWNIPYGFNESDFQISVQQLQMFLNQYNEIPYAAIVYLTGECNYGGRVTDMWDRRTISTILSDYVNAEVVHNPGYKFGESNIFVLPRKLEQREICKYIEEFIPNMPNPEVYGLHSNAGITRDLNTSNLLISSMQQTMGSTKLTSDKDDEKYLLNIVNDIKLKLPENFDIEICEQKYPVDYDESMNTVLIQEMQRFNQLLIEIRDTCHNLENSIKGFIVMTPEIEEICASIRYKKIPNRWMSKSYPSLKSIASYIMDFVERLKWLNNWYENGKPSTFWISGFYFTQAFLTGAMQNFARKYQIPIDTLTFDFQVLQIMVHDTAPIDGVYINGLYLDGAKWNLKNSHIEEQLPKILIDILPIIHLIPILSVKLNEGTRYKCPLYKTAERKGTLSTTGHSTNYVLPILLNTKKPQTHWIKRSVALLCQTND